MRFADIERPIGSDRLATSSEVRSAMLLSPLGAPELDGHRDDVLETDSEFCGHACNPHEDVMWLAIASEILDSICN